MAKSKLFPLFMLILATLIWGSTFAVVKDAMNEVNEYYIVFVRSLIAAIPLLIITYIKNKSSLFDLQLIKKGAIIGLALSLSYLFQNVGMLYTSASNSAFIIASNVILVPIFLFLFYKHSFNGKSIVSVIIVLGGLALLTLKEGSAINIGDFYSFLAATVTSFHIIWSGRFVKNSELLALVSYQFLFSALFSLFVSLILAPESLHLNYSVEAYSSLLYLGFLGTLFCYFTSIWSQKYLSYLSVSLVFSLEPVFAAIIAYFYLGEVLTSKAIFGAFLIVFGILFFELGSLLFKGKRKAIKR